MKITKLVFIISLFFSGAASATLWNVDGVLHGIDGGFGFSSLHDAGDSSPMSGAEFTKINSASGTYNDVTGMVDFTFGLANTDMLHLTGTLMFDEMGGGLSTNSELNYTGLDITGGTTIADIGAFGYMPNNVCCSGSFAPNSFLPASGDLNYMTLWGADFGSNIFDGSYEGSTVGMDFRLELSAVPIPAAFWLFGSAIFGFIKFSRKAKV